MGDSWRCNIAQYHRTCGVAQLSSWRSECWCVYMLRVKLLRNVIS